MPTPSLHFKVTLRKYYRYHLKLMNQQQMCKDRPYLTNITSNFTEKVRYFIFIFVLGQCRLQSRSQFHWKFWNL